MILDSAKMVFFCLLPVSLLLSIFFYQDDKAKDALSTQGTKISKQEELIRAIVWTIAFAVYLTGIILVVFWHKSYAWICIVICMPLYLGRIAGAYVSVGIIGKVVQSRESDKLSAREHWAIETASYTLFFLDAYKLPTKLLEYVANLESIPWSDFLYIALYVLLLFLYIFLTCALLPIPLLALAKLMIKVNKVLKHKTNIFRIGNSFIEKIDRQGMDRPVSMKMIEATREKHIICRVVVWIILPVVIVMDACWAIVKLLWSFLISSIGYVFLILRLLKRTAGKAATWMKRLSDRRLVVTSFRVALIATLALTVIGNRYSPLLRNKETSTAVLEFVASAVLIPVVFEWISATKNKGQ